MVQKLKDFVLPIAILLGLLFHGFFGKLGSLVPWLVFFMLYFTLCSIDIKKIRISMLHIWVLVFQILISICVYYIIKPFDETIAQGVLV
jgi:BASS family bile acid:Na+ symporter